MCDGDKDTTFTDHLLDQFGAYYTLTVLAVQVFAHLRAHYIKQKTQDVAIVKI